MSGSPLGGYAVAWEEEEGLRRFLEVGLVRNPLGALGSVRCIYMPWHSVGGFHKIGIRGPPIHYRILGSTFGR